MTDQQTEPSEAAKRAADDVIPEPDQPRARAAAALRIQTAIDAEVARRTGEPHPLAG